MFDMLNVLDTDYGLMTAIIPTVLVVKVKKVVDGTSKVKKPKAKYTVVVLKTTVRYVIFKRSC
jgi:hypothetical protein